MTGVPTSGDEREENIMPLINVVVVLIVVGVLLWLVNTYIPMDAKIKNILNAVVVIGVVIWLLQAFGLIGDLRAIRLGK
jgi:undecaprenyl pyrophosphate phosphatase UppP